MKIIRLSSVLVLLLRVNLSLKLWGALIHGWIIKLQCWLLYGNRIKIGHGFRVYGLGTVLKVDFSGGGTISIGDNLVLVNRTRYNYVGVVKPCSIVAINGCIQIGDNVGMSGVSMYSGNSILIEDYVTIGANCFIFDTNFHSLDAQDRINDHCNVQSSNVRSGPIVIGRNAFIGLNSVILKGSVIGFNSVIGACTFGVIKCESGTVFTKNNN